ncbi:NACHT domain-containing protein [Streptomyces sp. NPDC058405]|uniref:NACHT domain-containing protein n=1 Tax=Streptomyces sp. NPDC058405 TaxID=3346482 RepID=UPI00364AB6CF
MVRGRRRLLSFSDAVAVLGGDGAALAAADQALGGALSMATGGVSDTVLSVFDAQGRLLRLGRDLTSGLRDRLGSSERAERTERLAAAHAVLVVTAYFEALGDLELPLALRAMELTRSEQIRLAGGDDAAQDFIRTLVAAAVPQPAPHVPYEQVLHELHVWYAQLSERLERFARGLAAWDGLTEAQRQETASALTRHLIPLATGRYEELYARLALEVPEFGFWSGQVEHQATRAGLRQALTGIETALAGLSAVRPLTQVAASLATGYRKALLRPILAEGDAPSGVHLPLLGEGYVDPDFRVRAVPDGPGGPADEDWWGAAPVRSDLTEYLAGALTSVASDSAPLLVLGQPGAGKSVLTKILAARLPAAGFLPVRIILREIPTDADVQDQIEHAVRAATGERASWPELVRSAEGAVPVLLFDGFDELLQATGVSQSDYLLRVARFQQREADQGRPVLALVTSRTAVADRARCPEGTVALRLEPFRTEHIETWLTLWNRLNAPDLAAQGLRPLPAEVAGRHEALASQPLLLLMLALYDATSNALQRGATGDEPLGEAELYEELLTSFAVREVGKGHQPLTDRQLADRAEQELQRLSLIAFGMLNRHRQWITTAELEEDLTGLLGRAETAQADLRAPLNQAEIALGRFFFVQRGQAVRDDQRLTTYEFLHATFGEYLAARLAVQLLQGLAAQRPALALGRISVDDDLLYVLLSYAPLSSRQMLRFVDARIRRLTPEDRSRLGALLVTVMADHRDRTEHKFATYRPSQRATSSRHGLYGANLMILTVLVTGGTTASEVFPEAGDPVGTWHRHALLWRSAFTEPEWTDFSLAIRVGQTWSGDRRELTVLPGSPVGSPVPEPVDPHWLYGYPPGHEIRTRGMDWSRTYWNRIWHKMSLSGGTNDSVVLHALEPVFQRLGPSLTTFFSSPHGSAESVAHHLIELWLASGLGASEDELATLYERCADFLLPWWSFLDHETGRRVTRLVCRQLVIDAGRLPPDVAARVLLTLSVGDDDPHTRELVVRAAMATLRRHGPAEVREGLRAQLESDIAILVRTDPARILALWGEAEDPERIREWFGASPLEALRGMSADELRVVPPELLRRVRALAAPDDPAPPASA